MKVDLFSSLIYILVIILIIPGTISGMASAVDEKPGDGGSLSLDSRDSNLDTADSGKEETDKKEETEKEETEKEETDKKEETEKEETDKK